MNKSPHNPAGNNGEKHPGSKKTHMPDSKGHKNGKKQIDNSPVSSRGHREGGSGKQGGGPGKQGGGPGKQAGGSGKQGGGKGHH